MKPNKKLNFLIVKPNLLTKLTEKFLFGYVRFCRFGSDNN